MTPDRLQQALAAPAPPLVLDVRLADDYEAAHLPGAINNPVFEVAFHERLAGPLANKAQPVVLCGATGESMEAAMAAEKLERSGYSDVVLLKGGFADWIAAGLPVESGPPLPEANEAPDGVVEVDLKESSVEWLGRNLLNKHWGTIGIKSGRIEFADGVLAGGEIHLDLRRLECTDLAGSELHDVLIRHLQDHDFFDVERHPSARLTITSAKQISAGSPGAPNLRLTAALELRGQSHEISFDAVSGFTPDGRPAAQAAFAIDRTRWGVIYGSGRFFHRLGGHLVNDLIEFQVKIVGR